jgi:hypothetical protein
MVRCLSIILFIPLYLTGICYPLGFFFSVCKLETQRRVAAVAADVVALMAVQCHRIQDQPLSENARSKRAKFNDRWDWAISHWQLPKQTIRNSFRYFTQGYKIEESYGSENVMKFDCSSSSEGLDGQTWEL